MCLLIKFSAVTRSHWVYPEQLWVGPCWSNRLWVGHSQLEPPVTRFFCDLCDTYVTYDTMAWHCLRLGLCTVYLLKAFPQRLAALISPCFSICRWFARTFAGSMPRLHRYDEGLGAWPYHSQTSASSCETKHGRMIRFEKIIENPW